jgi:O6-methylguanine-DNA--protein-cysteine methyltransferase
MVNGNDFNAMVVIKNDKIFALYLGENENNCLKFLSMDSKEQFELNNRERKFESDIIKLMNEHTNNITWDCLDLDNVSELSKTVWKSLQNISLGQTLSYSDIAKMIEKSKSHRVVANVCAKNRFALLIPCHRVIHKNGNIDGYRFGNNLKRVILEKEKVFVQ